MIDELDKKIISLIQGDIPVVSRPFAFLAEKAGISEDEFIMRVNRLKDTGVMRRFGATLRHQEAGFNSNAMVAWLVPEDRVEEVSKIFATFKEVTHCYHRLPKKDWRFNVYTMIHGRDKEQCHETVKKLSLATGLHKHKLLFSQKEFKKTSMKYF